MHSFRALLTVVFLTAASTLSIPRASAGLNEQVAISLHISSLVTKNPCDVYVPPESFVIEQPILSGPAGPFYFVYLYACWGSDSVGIGGIECGIRYRGNYSPGGGAFPISVFGWTACSDLEFPSEGWPGPDTGNLMTWTRFNCHHPSSAPGIPRSELALAGYFYLAAYGSDYMSVIPRPASGRLKVADCFGVEDDLTEPDPVGTINNGGAGFGTRPGFNACVQIVPTRPETWSGIKTLHGK